MQVEQVDFVTVPTRDTGRAVAFYRDVLGLRESEYTESEIEASNVNLPDGTIVTFTHNGNIIGTQALALGRAELELRSQDGFTPPTVNRGDTVAVWSDGVVIVSGTF